MFASKSRGAVLAGIILVLVAYCVFKNHQYSQLSFQNSVAGSITFHDQFSQGKACGLITTKEASELIGTPVGTSGTIVPNDGPTSASHPGSPRIDSCTHTALKSSDGYIDLIIKTYDNKKDAAKYHAEEVKKYFPTEFVNAGSLGQELKYGSGVFYLLKDNQSIELSASKTPRVGSAETEVFARAILEKVVAKL